MIIIAIIIIVIIITLFILKKKLVRQSTKVDKLALISDQHTKIYQTLTSISIKDSNLQI